MQRLWVVLIVLIRTAGYGGPPLEVRAPGGVLAVSFRLDGRGVPQWRVTGPGGELLSWSRLGLVLREGAPLDSGFTLADSSTAEVDETYTLLAGKTATARNHCRELRVGLRRNGSGADGLELQFRAYDDGAAFRYRLPENTSRPQAEIIREETEFRFPSDMAAWTFQIAGFRSSFEGLYLPTTLDALADTALVYPPLTLQRTDGVTLAITEADLRDYAGMYLRRASARMLKVVLPPLPGAGEVSVRLQRPSASPWRVLMVGTRPGTLIESTIIENLNPPCALDDLSWIVPGKVMFPWWPDFYCDRPGVPSRMTYENQKYYIDFASAHGIAYLEVEPPWYGPEEDCIAHPERYDITHPVPELRLPELFAYGREKGVRLLLWAHWENIDRQADSAFSLFARWGAAGVKIDFMNRDDQEMVRWYHMILRKAAAHHLMVYFHGAPKPTGMQRTYPHLLTVEGVLGNEQNKVTRLCTPDHTVTLPFTRMLAGPMDFTPGGFRNVREEDFVPNYSRPTVMGTRCHQLAMFVVYESPLMMVCDDPAAYRNQPGLQFISEVPTRWDATRVIAGEIGQYIAIVRRRGSSWYLGVMTGHSPRRLRLPLSFLGTGDYTAELYRDGPNASRRPTEVELLHPRFTPIDTLDVVLAPGGGCAARFSRR